MLRIVLLCAFLVLVSSASLARDAVATDAVTRAAALLKSWRGDSRKLDAARTILTGELQSVPDSAPALREQARLSMLEGYLIGTEYHPENLAAATKSLDKAIALGQRIRTRICCERGSTRTWSVSTMHGRRWKGQKKPAPMIANGYSLRPVC